MRRFLVSIAALLALAAGAAAQTTAPGLEAGQETPPTAIPDIPAGEDPMNRKPDPAAGTPAAKGPPEPAAEKLDPVCRVVTGDGTNGLAVVCDEEEGEPGGG